MLAIAWDRSHGLSWFAWAVPVYFPGAAQPEAALHHGHRSHACRPVPGVLRDLHRLRVPPAPGTFARSGALPAPAPAARRHHPLLDGGAPSGPAVPCPRRVCTKITNWSRSGPYAIVRHPIYTSLLAMLVCSLLMLTPWQWAAICPRALYRRDGDSRAHRGPPAGIALRRTLLRVPQARPGLRAICAIVTFICSGAFLLISLAFPYGRRHFSSARTSPGTVSRHRRQTDRCRAGRYRRLQPAGVSLLSHRPPPERLAGTGEGHRVERGDR